MASTMDNQTPGVKAQAAALAGAAEAGAAILHDVAASASELGGGAQEKTAAAAEAPGPVMGEVRSAVAATSAAGRELLTLIRRYPLLSALAGLGLGFKFARAVYRTAPKKTAETENGESTAAQG